MDTITLAYVGGSDNIDFGQFADAYVQDQDAAFSALARLLSDGEYTLDGLTGPLKFTVLNRDELIAQAGEYSRAADGTLDLLHENVPQALLGNVAA